MKKITAVLLGAGGRGMETYGAYAMEYPGKIQFIAVAEPNPGRREKFKELHGIPEDMCFYDWHDLMEKPRLADAIVICTHDRMHFEPVVKSLERGYHILLEKPISPDPKECITIGGLAEKYNKVFTICYVLRYSRLFSTIKKLLDEGRIGRLISIQHNENVSYWHQAHSFVRGNWRNSDESSPMIMQKSCHDMDILLWLAGSHCTRISSFGTLSHFKKENAPAGAPERCTDGCPAENECIFHAPKIYLTLGIDWLIPTENFDTNREAMVKSLKEGPFGRCVYRCDNNVVDHQVVNMEFENEVTAAFTMCGFSYENGRTIKLMGTEGEIRGVTWKNEIEVIEFSSGRKDVIQLKSAKGGHDGADDELMNDFVRLVSSEDNGALTAASTSVESHIMAFAAEKSRLENKVIEIKEFVKELSTAP